MKKEKSTLTTLILGTVLYFIIATIPVLIIAQDKLRAEIGLITGTVVAILRLVHMNAVLQHSMYMEKNQSAYITVNSVGRMLVVLGILVVTAMTGWTNFVTMLIGMFGEKISALANPILTGILQKITKQRR